MRWPSTSTSVASTVRPRSDTPEAPPARAPEKFCVSDPELSADTVRITSDTVILPLLMISSELITSTGEGVSASVRRRYEPVTTTVSSSAGADAFGAGGLSSEASSTGSRPASARLARSSTNSPSATRRTRRPASRASCSSARAGS